MRYLMNRLFSALAFAGTTFLAEDVFHVGNGAPANFPDGTIKVSFNGQVTHSRYSVGSNTIGQLLNSLATQKGVRTFSAYADGRKLTTADAGKPASEFKEVDIVAKDARGTFVTV